MNVANVALPNYSWATLNLKLTLETTVQNPFIHNMC